MDRQVLSRVVKARSVTADELSRLQALHDQADLVETKWRSISDMHSGILRIDKFSPNNWLLARSATSGWQFAVICWILSGVISGAMRGCSGQMAHCHDATSFSAGNPLVSILDVGSLDCGPRNPMRRLLLPWIAHMRRERVIEGFAINVLRVGRQMLLHRRRQVVISPVRHRFGSQFPCPAAKRIGAIWLAVSDVYQL
jgi:hypothetical protein